MKKTKDKLKATSRMTLTNILYFFYMCVRAYLLCPAAFLAFWFLVSFMASPVRMVPFSPCGVPSGSLSDLRPLVASSLHVLSVYLDVDDFMF